MKRFPAFESYTVKENTINLTTAPIDKDHPGCLVDRKLVDILLQQVVKMPFAEAKDAIIEKLVTTTSFDEMVTSFNDAIYIHQVCELVKAADIVEEQVKIAEVLA